MSDSQISILTWNVQPAAERVYSKNHGMTPEDESRGTFRDNYAGALDFICDQGKKKFDFFGFQGSSSSVMSRNAWLWSEKS